MDMHFTPEAKSTINAMRTRVAVIGAHYGDKSDEYRKASDTLMSCLVTMIGLGGRISSDGELSLYGSSEHIAYGVNWSPKRFKDDDGNLRTDDLLGSWSVNS